jgi:stalled ribosome alternative rescue factor ArfA
MESDDDFKLSKRKAHNEAGNKRDNLVEEYPIRQTRTSDKLNTKKKGKGHYSQCEKIRQEYKNNC